MIDKTHYECINSGKRVNLHNQNFNRKVAILLLIMEDGNEE